MGMGEPADAASAGTAKICGAASLWGDLILHSLLGLVPPQDGSGVSLRSSGIEKKSLILEDGFQNQYIWYFLRVLWVRQAAFKRERDFLRLCSCSRARFYVLKQTLDFWKESTTLSLNMWLRCPFSPSFWHRCRQPAGNIQNVDSPRDIVLWFTLDLGSAPGKPSAAH